MKRLFIIPLLIATITVNAMDAQEISDEDLSHFRSTVDQFLIAAGVLHEDEIEAVQKAPKNNHQTHTATVQDLEMIDNSAVSENSSSDKISLEAHVKLLSEEPKENPSHHLVVRWLNSSKGAYPVLYRYEGDDELEQVWEPLKQLRGYIPSRYYRSKSAPKLKRVSRSHKTKKR